MEMTTKSLSQANLPKSPLSFTPSPILSSLHSKSPVFASNSVSFPSSSSKRILMHRQGVKIKSRKQKNLAVVHASESEIPPKDVAERWLLEPVGDGDTRHIGFKVEMPNAFEIVSDEVTVGRLPDKADMVIPVATVSARHARIRKKEGNLLVTDLDSTNGTFIDEKRLRPGVVSIASPGSSIAFGDIHLAMFRVSKLENVETSSNSPEGSERETSSPIEISETP
ncbi:hypothetical protein FNV43_RR04560 [Rhamnella rubrinervis]|uniref:FHA domain-containing protein n=1 Tax=Rhamnella rubrinervis TaxID=2594499 RepID=A0A8K0HL92_9ROSA|nr:hypothetical protein FNV43_RR04560 [Rhamnella rubrinervis]